MDSTRRLTGENIADMFALTPMQEGMLFHYLQAPQGDAYFEQLRLTISGEIQQPAFEGAWKAVIRTNEMLRTVFRWEKVREPVQVILKEVDLKPVYYDLTHPGPTVEEVMARDRQEKFDLRRVPFRVTLCKLTKNRYEMIISHHHILYDGWSNHIILREFFRAYEDLAAHREPVRPVKTGFGAFVRWLKDPQNQDPKGQREFWQAYLRGFDNRAPLLLAPVKNQADNCCHQHEVACPLFLKEKMASLVRRSRISMASLLYGAWGILLLKYCHSLDVVFGTTVAGRSPGLKGIEEIVGLFINTIPLRVKADPDDGIMNLLREINDTLQVRQKYEAAALVDIAAYAGLSMPPELFDTIVVVENYPLDLDREPAREPAGQPGLRLEGYGAVEMTHYDLGLAVEIAGEGDMAFKFVYRSAPFAADSIDRLAGHFMRIIENMVLEPDRKLAGIDILSPEERRQILVDFNGVTVDYPGESGVHQLVASQAQKAADHTAVGLGPGDHHLSYRLLNDGAFLLAGRLRSQGIGADSIVAIQMERRLELIVGILAILQADCAYLPLDPESPRERVEYMLTDSGASLLLTTAFGSANDSPEANPLSIRVAAAGEGLAYCIYTSGSTGRPKGVMVGHRALANFLYSLHHCYGGDFGPGDRGLSIANITFDVSVGEIFMPLVFGACLVLLPKQKTYDPEALSTALAAESITFAYIHPHLLTEVADNLQASGLRLALNKMLVGVEPIRDRVLAAYLQLNPALRIVNGYGPTEATICATFFPFGSQPLSNENVPIGRPLANTRIWLLEQLHNPVPVAVAGELCISGRGLARGYLNNPELTADKFLNLAASTSPKPLTPKSQILYRTGDLARFLPDGNIRFLGRVDHQVKIRGFRIELGEIENQLRRHPLVKQAVVAAREDKENEKYLAAYIVPQTNRTSRTNKTSPLKLRQYLAEILPDYMIPAYFVFLDQIPLTPSGKTDRGALPEPQLQSVDEGTAYTAPRDKLEEELVSLWADVLGLPVSVIGIDNRFFNLGGHSLKAMHLVSRIHKVFDVRVPLPEFFQLPTVRRLADYISRAADDPYRAIAPVEKREYYRVSSAQRRLYILHQVDDRTTRYNLTGAVSIEGNLERQRLEEAFGQLVRRHESLRSTFEVLGREPVQRIHRQVDFKVDYYDSRTTADVVDDFFQPFDLGRPPLLRVGLIRQHGQSYLLLVNIHHIISDETSMTLLEKEFWALYAGEALPALKLQYRDFCQWQNRLPDSPLFEKQAQFWLNRFKGEIPVLDLPLDYPRPPVLRADGSRVSFELDEEITAGIKKRAVESETTTFMFLLTVYNVLLARYSGQADIVVGSPVAGRRHLDLMGIIGLFVNILPLRNFPHRQKTFRAFLGEVKQNVLQAFENQEYPFERLVWNLQLKVDPCRNPLFDVVFVLRNPADRQARPPKGKEPGIVGLRPYEVARKKIHNELILEVNQGSHNLSMVLEYSTELFTESTARKTAAHFAEILGQVLANPDIQLGDIRLSSACAPVRPDSPQDESRGFRL
jgi:amino acid adenylation domain-containing protein